MRKFPLLLFFLLPLFIFAQSSGQLNEQTQLEKPPQYPGGPKALSRLFNDSIEPLGVKWEELTDAEQDGHLVLSLAINEKGEVEAVKVLTSMGDKSDTKCANLARKLKFMPATFNDKPVKSKYILHIDRED